MSGVRGPSRSSVRSVAFALAAVLGMAGAPAALAANRTVAIAGFEYSPSPVNAEVGDTVTWNNEGFITHTVTANNGAFDSGVITGKTSFSFKFTAPGNFEYSCTIHRQMRGEVVVKAAHGGSEGGSHHMPMPMPAPMPMPGAMPPAPRPGAGASGPVGISLRVSHRSRAHRRITAVAIRTTRPGANILLELYSREHFSWRQIAHAKADANGNVVLLMHFTVRQPLRVVVPSAPGESASISAVTYS